LAAFSATDTYIPNQFYGLQDVFFGLGSHRSQFQNPASLLSLSEGVTQFAAVSDFFGTQQVYGSTVLRFSSQLAAQLGFGYVVNEGAIQTALDENGRPIAVSNFQEQFFQPVFSLAAAVYPGTSLALRLSGTRRQSLQSARNHVSLDVGLSQSGWLGADFGVYTRGLVPISELGPWTFSSEGSREIIGYFRVPLPFGYAGIESNGVQSHVGGELILHPDFSLACDILVDRLNTQSRVLGTGLGARFQVGGMGLYYRWVRYGVPDFLSDQHLLGITLSNAM